MGRTLTAVVAALLLVISAAAFADEDLYAQALNAYKAKNYVQSASLLEKSIEKEPSAKAYYLLGYSYYSLGKNEQASKCFKDAYLLDPAFDPASIFAAGDSETK